MKGQVVYGVTKNGLLDKENITSTLFDLFADIQKVLTLLFQDLVHLAIVIDDDLVVNLKTELWCGQRKRKNKKHTSGFGGESWNWINPILAFSILLGPPALLMTFWVKIKPSIMSVSSIVPPNLVTKRISRRSTLIAVAGSMT